MFRTTQPTLTRINSATASARNLILVIGFLIAGGPVGAVICPNWFFYHTPCGQSQDPPGCNSCTCPAGSGGGSSPSSGSSYRQGDSVSGSGGPQGNTYWSGCGS